MQVISVTDSLYRSIIVRTAEKRWKLHDLSPHHRPSSVSQTDWASFTDPLWLDLQNRVSPAWGSAPVDVKLFPPHPPWWQEGKKTLSRPEPTHSTEGRKSGGAEKGEAVNGRLSWWRGRAVYAWDLPICSFYFHNSISLSHFLFFLSSLLPQGSRHFLFCHSSDYSAACVLSVKRHLLHHATSASRESFSQWARFSIAVTE